MDISSPETLRSAAVHIHLTLLQYLRSLGAAWHETMLADVAEKGLADMLNVLLAEGVVDLSPTLRGGIAGLAYHAAKGGHQHLLRLHARAVAASPKQWSAAHHRMATQSRRTRATPRW